MYYYRFIRTKVNGAHKSELDEEITFYNSDDCNNNHDFTWNQPVVTALKAGMKVQLLFGASSIDDAVKVLECFGCYSRLLARFEMSSVESLSPVTIHDDEQVNIRVGSKYLMAEYKGEPLTVPDEAVEVLSKDGWVAKKDALNVHKIIQSLSQDEYKKLIQNSTSLT